MFKNYCVAVTNKEFPTKEEQAEAKLAFTSGNRILYYSKIVFVKSFKALETKVECAELLNLSDNKDINEFYKDVLVGYEEPVVEEKPVQEVVQEVVEAPKEEAPTPPKKAPVKRARRTTKAKTEG